MLEEHQTKVLADIMQKVY